MRKILDFAFLVAVVAIAGYLAYTNPQAVRGLYHMAQNAVKPCGQPLTYSIGDIDPKFKLSRSLLKEHLLESERAWESPSKRDLFLYAEKDGNVTVHLKYDARQGATDKLKAAGYRIDTSKAAYDSLKAKYESLAAGLKNKKAQYEAAIDAYEAHEARYNAEVQKWNSRGGAPSNVYEDLQREKSQLQSEFYALNNLKDHVNDDIDTINALATQLNQLIVQLNINVDQYNETGAATGEFEEGLYELEGGVQTITIFEFSNRIELERVLAHEMGHAIGLEHIEDKQALMYKVNMGNVLVATKADLEELERACTPRYKL